MSDDFPTLEQARAAVAVLKEHGLSLADLARAKGKSGRHGLALATDPDTRRYVVSLAKRYGWKP